MGVTRLRRGGGLGVPTGNPVMEPEFGRMSPAGVSVHANRAYLKDVTPESLLAMESEVQTSPHRLAAPALRE